MSEDSMNRERGGLTLSIRAGELLRVNGADIFFKTPARVCLKNKCRFVFGKQVMQSDEARTHWSRAYYALQEAYVGDRRSELAEELVELPSEILLHIVESVCHDDLWSAMKIARQFVEEERRVISAAEEKEN